MFTSRLLRKRWVLAVIFACSFIYFIARLLRPEEKGWLADEYEVKHTLLRQPFQWQPNIGDDENGTKPLKCRNSIQGIQIIADDRGYVCERSAILIGGCCDSSLTQTSRYNCNSCHENHCCVIYEYCVSCCLHPDKQQILKKILRQPLNTYNQLFSSLKDHYELCLMKCRTSSQSVQHENSYRNPQAKHCYGENPPDIQPLIP
ncbi:UPF0454 protein C12orf49 homolog [Argonauta hians]